jgi:hypothetical protein
MASIVTVALAIVTALTVTVQSVRGTRITAAVRFVTLIVLFMQRTRMWLVLLVTRRSGLRALCSPACQDGCPNIVDLYATLAAGEGVSLPALCDDAQRIAGSGYHRMMAEVSPLGAPAAAPMWMTCSGTGILRIMLRWEGTLCVPYNSAASCTMYEESAQLLCRGERLHYFRMK